MGLIGLSRVVVGPLLFAEFGKYYSQLRSERPVEYALLYVSPVLQVLSAAFVLSGHNWARWFLGTWIGLLALASAWNANFKVAVVDSLWFVITAYYLFRSSADAFFSGPFEAVPPQKELVAAEPPVERKVTGNGVGESGRAEPPPPLI